jgi:hypothetical protein
MRAQRSQPASYSGAHHVQRRPERQQQYRYNEQHVKINHGHKRKFNATGNAHECKKESETSKQKKVASDDKKHRKEEEEGEFKYDMSDEKDDLDIDNIFK